MKLYFLTLVFLSISLFSFAQDSSSTPSVGDEQSATFNVEDRILIEELKSALLAEEDSTDELHNELHDTPASHFGVEEEETDSTDLVEDTPASHFGVEEDEEESTNTVEEVEESTETLEETGNTESETTEEEIKETITSPLDQIGEKADEVKDKATETVEEGSEEMQEKFDKVKALMEAKEAEEEAEADKASAKAMEEKAAAQAAEEAAAKEAEEAAAKAAEEAVTKAAEEAAAKAAEKEEAIRILKEAAAAKEARDAKAAAEEAAAKKVKEAAEATAAQAAEETVEETTTTVAAPNSDYYDDPDTYMVQVAAYGDKVDPIYFKNMGVKGVFEQFALGTLYKYYTGPFESRVEAESKLGEVVGKGFPYARVINMSEVQELCSMSCQTATPMTSVLVYAKDQIIKVKNIFFEFNSSFLNAEGKEELRKLGLVLNENAGYVVEVHAHTDSKGSNEYNLALSERRKNSVVNYLTYLKVPPFKIQAFAHGETQPIARNEMNGNDSPQGRSYNRRVELRVKDEFKAVDVVEDILVPESLRRID